MKKSPEVIEVDPYMITPITDEMVARGREMRGQGNTLIRGEREMGVVYGVEDTRREIWDHIPL